MAHRIMSYNRVSGHRRQALKGFWLRRKCFSLQWIRLRFFCLVRLLFKWKFPYGQAMKLIKKGVSRKRIVSRDDRERSNLPVSGIGGGIGLYGCTSEPYDRSSSFHSEAISECLEFIKMSAATAAPADKKLSTSI